VKRTGTQRTIFITGTDAGIGRALLTGLLLRHLRQSGFLALAMNPFRSGSRADAEFLHAVQDAELTPDENSPFLGTINDAMLMIVTLQTTGK